MAEPTITQVFGSGATQDATTLTISKADLTGLTANTTNTAESLLVAILIKSKSYLTSTNFDNNIDQSIRITNGFPSFVTRNNQEYRINQLTIDIAKIDEGSNIDPDDY